MSQIRIPDINAATGINVTEFPVGLPAASTLSDAHKIRMTYDLSSPGAASFSHALVQNSLQNASQHMLCSLVVYADFAPRVIDAYDPHSPYQCTVPLGEACALAMMNSVTGSETDENGCPTSVQIDELDECAGVLADTPGSVTYTSVFSSTSNATVHEGESFLQTESEVYGGSNGTQLMEEVARRLQVAFFTHLDVATSNSTWTSSICVIVDADYGSASQNTMLIDDGSSGDGNGAMQLTVSYLVAFAVTASTAMTLT